jgi:hypothetical protein
MIAENSGRRFEKSHLVGCSAPPLGFGRALRQRDDAAERGAGSRRKSNNKNTGEPVSKVKREWLQAHVDYDGEECLIWPFSRDPNGYGHCGADWAHRVMCALVHGPAPTEDHETAHSCGRGKFGCVHPKHVSWKTRSENQLERRRHGTHGKRKGVRYWLTPGDVAHIRALRGKKTQRELAKIYGVSWQTIGMVQRGETWKTGFYAMGRPRADAGRHLRN